MATTPVPTWARWWFRGAALYGAAVLLALFAGSPPPIGALYYYGFAGTALAFQVVFWIIGGDPRRYRPLMLAAVLEKLAFVGPVAMMASQLDRVGMAAGAVDLVLGIGFVLAWRATPRS